MPAACANRSNARCEAAADVMRRLQAIESAGAALLADLERPKSGLLFADLLSSAQAARVVSDFRAEEQAKKKLEQRAKKEAEPKDPPPGLALSATTGIAAATRSPKPPENKAPPLPQRVIQDEAAARFDAAIGANVGFVERLVWFWSNHFCVSADKDIAMVGAYEREAIRPHVLGRFGDMLQAVESHPAMLYYLDNVQSMGGGSIAGINRDKGLNENLAREILELHTLGVRSGYSQADVTSFANVLTGWTWIDPAEPEHGGEFLFNKRLHEPGEQFVLGKRYPDTGVEQGRAMLADLARHPTTAQHIALKFARHFVADEPPPSLVAKLAKTFKDTDGNLKEVAKTVVTAEESWTPQRTKLKRPCEWIVGVARLADAVPPCPREKRSSKPACREPSGRTSAVCSRSRPCLGKPYGGRRPRTDTPTRRQRGSTACRADWMSPMNLPGTRARKPIRSICSIGVSVRSPRQIRAKPSRGRKAGRKRLRSLSWRQNICGDDHAALPRSIATRGFAHLRYAVRLGAHAAAGAR